MPLTKLHQAMMSLPFMTALQKSAKLDGEADDSAAVTGLIEDARDTSYRAVIEGGSARLQAQSDVPMQVNQNVALSGGGMHSSTFVIDNATGGIKIGSSSQRQFTVTLQDMHIDPALPQSGRPIDLERFAGGLENDSTFNLINVAVGHLNDTDAEDRDFSEGVSVTGGYRTRLQNLRVWSRNSTTGSKWDAIVNVSGSYKPELLGCYGNVSDGVGATYGVKDHGATEEGFLMSMTTFNGADIGLSHTRNQREPEYQIYGCHVNSKFKNIFIDGFKLGFIDKPLLYQADNSTADIFADIHLVNAEFFHISYPMFRQSPNDRRRHIWLEPRENGAVRNITIYLDEACLAASTGGIAPIFIKGGVARVTIHLPSRTAVTVGASYPALKDLIEISSEPDANGDVANPDEIVVILDGGGGVMSLVDGVEAGPDLDIIRASPNPVAGNRLGQINMSGLNAAGDVIPYFSWLSVIGSPTAGAEDGRGQAFVYVNGSRTLAAEIFEPAANDDTGLRILARKGGVVSLEQLRFGPDGSGPSGAGRAVYID